jgi:RNA polymerase sigma-70 factor, ECF subfamily
MADVLSGGDDLAKIVAEHHQAVYRYAYRLTGSIHDAEDLTQEVFLAAQRKIGQLRSMDTVKSWLFAILRNCFLKDRQRKRPAMAADLELDVGSIAEESPPEDDFDRDRLQAALNRLPEVFRVAVVMYYFEECSYREIAEHLSLPIGTVMSRLARAKDHLRSLLLEPERKTTNDGSAKRGERDAGRD